MPRPPSEIVERVQTDRPVSGRTDALARDLVVEYVGFWARVGASLIDTVVVLLVTSPLLYALYGAAYFERPPNTPAAGLADLLISYLFPAIAVILFWRYKSATPGKMLIRARIVDARTLDAPSTGQLVGRYLGYYLSALLFLLGFLWVAFDRRKQGLHDKLARTLVIRDHRLGTD